MIPFEFRRDIWHQKTRFLAGTIVWHYLRDPTFSRFDTILECVDTQTHTTTAYTALSIAVARKKNSQNFHFGGGQWEPDL